MTKFFFKLKKPYYWSILACFPNSGGKKSFSMKSSCYAQLLKGFWHLAKFQRNLMIQFQENTQMSGGKDGQTLFHRILPATASGLTSKTAVKWHLKVKDMEYNVGPTKSYCIKVSMQKISSLLNSFSRFYSLLN